MSIFLVNFHAFFHSPAFPRRLPRDPLHRSRDLHAGRVFQGQPLKKEKQDGLLLSITLSPKPVLSPLVCVTLF
jgi:hypothetical protein